MKKNQYLPFETRGEALQGAKSILGIKDYRYAAHDGYTSIYVSGTLDYCEIDELDERIYVWKDYDKIKKGYKEFYILEYGDKNDRERQDQEDSYDDYRTE